MIPFSDLAAVQLGFPVWVRAAHILNVLFLTLLVRSGLEILSSHPRLYWNDPCRPGSEWLKFTSKSQVMGEIWTGRDEEVSFSSWIALPGQQSLGLGRHWHFFSVAAWILTGLVYVILLFTLDEWRRLIPTTWAVFPDAWQALRTYISFHLPPSGNPYNALQQLTYAAVIFLLAPVSIATGAAMSPAVAARFPWYTRILGGRQAARSLHFLSLLAFIAFTIVHTFMVVAHGLPEEWGKIVLGVSEGQHAEGIIVGIGGLVVIVLIHAVGTWYSLRWPRRAQHLLRVIDPLRRLLLHHLTSKQAYRRSDISTSFWANGLPPKDPVHDALARDHFLQRWLARGCPALQPGCFNLIGASLAPPMLRMDDAIRVECEFRRGGRRSVFCSDGGAGSHGGHAPRLVLLRRDQRRDRSGWNGSSLDAGAKFQRGRKCGLVRGHAGRHPARRHGDDPGIPTHGEPRARCARGCLVPAERWAAQRRGGGLGVVARGAEPSPRRTAERDVKGYDSDGTA